MCEGISEAPAGAQALIDGEHGEHGGVGPCQSTEVGDD